MRKTFSLLSIIVICIIAFSCKANLKENKNMNTKFKWDFTIAAPRHYPVEAKYATITFGEEGSFDAMDLTPQVGIGYPTGSNFNPDNYKEDIDLPTGLHILWASFADRKYYKADIEFSDELRKKMLLIFREGYHDTFENKHQNYCNVVATLLPGGHIWLYVNDDLIRSILVCDTLKGKEVKLKPERTEFAEDPTNPFENLEKASALAMKDNFHSDEILKKYGCSDTIWENYKRRYNYHIKMDFENKETKFIPVSYTIHYANGEIQNVADKGYFPRPAIPMNLEFQWTVNDMLYEGHFYFDESEIIHAYKKIYGSFADQEGTLVIKVSKYNNWFDIYLVVGDKKYRIVDTKIHVFRKEVHESDDKAVVIYDNHPQDGNNPIIFMGE